MARGPSAPGTAPAPSDPRGPCGAGVPAPPGRGRGVSRCSQARAGRRRSPPRRSGPPGAGVTTPTRTDRTYDSCSEPSAPPPVGDAVHEPQTGPRPVDGRDLVVDEAGVETDALDRLE